MRVVLICFLLICTRIQGQDTKGEMAAYNVALGSIVGGIGAVINKEPDEKFGKVFFKGMYQGALGGYLVYESKNLVGKISSNNRLEYSWAAKFTNAAGVSIIENAASNKSFWEKWHFNIGFNRFEFHTKDEFRFRYKILPLSFLATSYAALTNKFEFNRSLQTGEFIFSNDTVGLTTDEAAGITYGNVVIINTQFLNDFRFYSHEIIHIYQYYDFNFVNSFLDRPINGLESKSNFIRKLNSFFYWDLQAPVLLSLYIAENSNRSNYYDNFFENEAGFWSNTIFVIPGE